MALASVHTSVRRALNPDAMAWDIAHAGEAEAEMDARWSFVGNKGNPDKVLAAGWRRACGLVRVAKQGAHQRDEVELRGVGTHDGLDEGLEPLACVALPSDNQRNMAVLRTGTAVPGVVGTREVKPLLNGAFQARAGEEHDIPRPMALQPGAEPPHARG